MNPDDFTEPQRLALAYIVGGERQKTRDLKQRDSLGSLIEKLLANAPPDLSEKERAVLAHRVRREIETNRYPLAVHLASLKSAFAKLAPSDDPLKPPASLRRKTPC